MARSASRPMPGGNSGPSLVGACNPPRAPAAAAARDTAAARMTILNLMFIAGSSLAHRPIDRHDPGAGLRALENGLSAIGRDIEIPYIEVRRHVRELLCDARFEIDGP